MNSPTVVKWRFDDFIKLTTQPEPISHFESEIFTLDDGAKCHLILEPAGDDYLSDFSIISIWIDKLGRRPVLSLTVTLRVENTLGQAIEFKPHTGAFDATCLNADIALIHHDALYPPTSDFVKDDVVIIHCEIHQHDLGFESALPPRPFYVTEGVWTDGTQDGKNDIVFRVQGKDFKVNRALLLTHQQVFDKILSTCEKDPSTGALIVAKTRPEIFQAFVQYLRTYKIDNLDDIAEELFTFADEYDVTILKKKCAESLMRTLSLENVVKRLCIAFERKDEELKKHVLAFATDRTLNDNLSSIMESPEWAKLKSENEWIAGEVTDAIVEVMH